MTSAPAQDNRHDAPRPESGNVLFLILIAVVLFAALSLAVSNITRSGGGEGRQENTSIRAAQIIQYATYTEQALLRMRFREVEDNAFCFDHDGWGHDDYYHAGCDTAAHHVFSSAPNAGGVVWSKPPRGANNGSDWFITGTACVAGIGENYTDNCHNDGSGDSEEIVMILPYVSRDVCIAINKSLNIPNPEGNPPRASGNLFTAGSYFAGHFADGTRIDSGGTNMAVLRGASFGCVEGNGTPPAGSYHYFHVLLPR